MIIETLSGSTWTAGHQYTLQKTKLLHPALHRPQKDYKAVDTLELTNSSTRKYRKGPNLDRKFRKTVTEYANLISNNFLHKPTTYNFYLEETAMSHYGAKKG